jgi:ribosomal protein L29
MKKQELVSFTSKKPEELKKELLVLKLDFVKTRLNISAGREKNLKKAKNIDKKIAQISTLLKYKSKENEFKSNDIDNKK